MVQFVRTELHQSIIQNAASMEAVDDSVAKIMPITFIAVKMEPITLGARWCVKFETLMSNQQICHEYIYQSFSQPTEAPVQ